MPPREEMDPWQQPPSGGREWRDQRAYYGESRQQQQQYAGASAYPPPPQSHSYRVSRPTPLPMRRMAPPPGESPYGRRGGEGGYYDRGGVWQPAASRRPAPQLPYRAPDERPYMPMYEEMRPEHPRLEGGPPPSQPQVRIQFRPNSGRHHYPQATGTPKSPAKKERTTKSPEKEKENEKEKEKDGDSLSLLAKVSFAMQTSPSGSHDEEDSSPSSEKGSPKEKQQEEKTSPGVEETPKKEKPPQDTPSPPDQKLPAPSPLLAAANNNTTLSPITPECWTPKHSNQSPGHRRNHSAGSILRTPRGVGLTPLITPASTRQQHRRDNSIGVDSSALYHQRWGSFAEGPHTPHPYSPQHGPPPPPTPGDTPYGAGRDYLTMEQIATPPDPRLPQQHGMTPPQQRRGGYPLPPQPQYRSAREQWEREQGMIWRSREGYERPPYDEYPPVVTRGSSYEEEGGPPPHYRARYPPPPEWGAESGRRYWREPYPEGPPPSYATPRRVDSRRPPYMPYQHSQTAVTPSTADEQQQQQGPPIMEGDAMYRTAPYTYVQQPRLEEKTVLRKKFSWKHYPELERFLISNRDEYLRHSALNYTAEQKQYNNWLTEQLLEVAARHNYEFDPEEFNFVAVRDRIRCYYKSYVQTARKRGLIIHGHKTLSKRVRTGESEQEEEEQKGQEETSKPAEEAASGTSSQ